MSSNKSTDPRMTKVEDPKSIYYQYSSLKKLLSEEDIQLMQPLEDSLKQQDQLKPPFGKCYFCKDPTHWIGDCPEAKKPRSQQASEQKKPPFGQCYTCGSPNHWAPDCPQKNEMDSSSVSPSSTLEKQQPSTSTESSTVATEKLKRPFGQCCNCRSPNHWTPDCPLKNEIGSSSISPGTLEKQQPSTSTEISTSRKRKLPDTDSEETVPSKKMKTCAGSRKKTSRKQHCFVCKSDSHRAKDCSDIVVDRSEQAATDEE